MPELEHDLAALADWPPTPDLAPAVLRRLAPAPRRQAPRRLVVALAAAIVLVPAAALAAYLGLRHVDVQRRPLPPARARPILGRSTTLGQAARTAGFRPFVPRALAGGAVYVKGRRITIVRRRLLLAQEQGDLPGILLRKIVGVAGVARRVRVNGDRGVWFPHPTVYFWRDPHGAFRDTRPVRSGPSLVWEQGNRVLRLEGDRSLPEALRDAAP